MCVFRKESLNLGVNNIWNAICRDSGVEGRICYSVRHAIGDYLMEKTGNVAAVQKQQFGGHHTSEQ